MRNWKPVIATDADVNHTLRFTVLDGSACFDTAQSECCLLPFSDNDGAGSRQCPSHAQGRANELFYIEPVAESHDDKLCFNTGDIGSVALDRSLILAEDLDYETQETPLLTARLDRHSILARSTMTRLTTVTFDTTHTHPDTTHTALNGSQGVLLTTNSLNFTSNSTGSLGLLQEGDKFSLSWDPSAPPGFTDTGVYTLRKTHSIPGMESCCAQSSVWLITPLRSTLARWTCLPIAMRLQASHSYSMENLAHLHFEASRRSV